MPSFSSPSVPSPNALQLRRASDSAGTDFYATSTGSLFTSPGGAGTALSTWAGVQAVYVTTWYDQGGGGRHATQAVAGSQPQLVFSGHWTTAPVVRFSSATSSIKSLLFDGSFALFQDYTMIVHVARTAAAGHSGTDPNCNYYIAGSDCTNTAANLLMGWQQSTVAMLDVWGGAHVAATVPAYTSTAPIAGEVHAARLSRAFGLSFMIDGVLKGHRSNGTGYLRAWGGAAFGRLCTSCGFSGDVAEAAFYSSHLDTADVNRVTGCMKGVTMPAQPTGTCAKLSTARRVYSLQRRLPSYTGPVVKVRRATLPFALRCVAMPCAGNGAPGVAGRRRPAATPCWTENSASGEAPGCVHTYLQALAGWLAG